MSDALQEAKEKFDASAAKVITKMNDLAQASKMHLLQAEEVDLLKSFRTFKLRIKKPKMFQFMTRPYE